MAASKSARGARERSPLRLVLFIACILATLGCMYMMLDFQNGAEPKLTGELIVGQVDTGVPANTNAPILGFFFEYFGLLSYAFAFLISYVGYYVFLKPTDIWHIDFYKTGLRILGFNFLMLGLAGLLSRYSDLSSTGAGGLLGDMLNMFFDVISIPHVISVLLFALIAFSGFAYFFGKDPFYVFDKVGEAFFKVLPARNEKSNKQDQSKAKQRQLEKLEPQGLNAWFSRPPLTLFRPKFYRCW